MSDIAINKTETYFIETALDMFETMNNVTGDLIYTYTVANSENSIDS
jgi:Na+/H+-dicarboxylate symporter